jgi:hypothetical protein
MASAFLAIWDLKKVSLNQDFLKVSFLKVNIYYIYFENISSSTFENLTSDYQGAGGYLYFISHCLLIHNCLFDELFIFEF